MREHEAFEQFKFGLGQRVRHRVDEIEGIVCQRVLVQNQHGGTGHSYMVAFGTGAYVDVVEIELEAAEDAEDQG